jgi:septal ring factor EnvC (AmiA/AmiB activator)
MMDIITHILVPFFAGGGVFWIMHFRLRARRDGNRLRQEEFNAVSEIVERATRQISDLSDKIARIEEEKAELKSQVLFLIEENKRLDKENQNLSATIKRYMSA